MLICSVGGGGHRILLNSSNLKKKTRRIWLDSFGFGRDLAGFGWICLDQILILPNMAGVPVYHRSGQVARVLEKESRYSTRRRHFLEAETRCR